jgi:hypothetical protein
MKGYAIGGDCSRGIVKVGESGVGMDGVFNSSYTASTIRSGGVFAYTPLK